MRVNSETRSSTHGSTPWRSDDGEPREILARFLRGGGRGLRVTPTGGSRLLGRHAQLGPGFFTMEPDGRRLVHSKESPGFPRAQTRVDLRAQAVWVAIPQVPRRTSRLNQMASITFGKRRVDPSTLAWRFGRAAHDWRRPRCAPLPCRVTARHSRSLQSKGSQPVVGVPIDAVARRLGSGKPPDRGRRDGRQLQVLTGRPIRRGRPDAPRHSSSMTCGSRTSSTEQASSWRVAAVRPYLVVGREGACLPVFATRQRASHREGRRRGVGGKERFVSR